VTADEVAASAVAALGRAFLAGDVEAVLALFAADGAVVYAGSEPGEIAVGTDDLRRLLDELFARDERYTWPAGTVHATAVPAGVLVVADTVLSVHPADDPAGAPVESLPYRVAGLLEHDDGWRWRMCQGSEPSPG
jgi:hypothetical protein